MTVLREADNIMNRSAQFNGNFPHAKPNSQVVQSITCPIPLEIMRDPVILTQSGVSYDREYLLRYLLFYTNKDPSTNRVYKEPLTYAPNLELRAVLTMHMGKHAYVPFNDENFASLYQKAWENMETTKPESNSSAPTFQAQAVASTDFLGILRNSTSMYERIITAL